MKPKNQTRFFLCLLSLLSLGTFKFAGIGVEIVSADNTPQRLTFGQNWTNTNLITTNDDWSGVPGIVGYRGDDLVTATGVDPRTILVDGSATPVDVNANQTNPETFVTGGVTEFEITNPVVALTGSADDAMQQVDVQYRVGGTGNYTSVPGGYIADATTAGSATQVTPLNLTLPANANNQSLLEIRVITTNAVGNDEWVGIDDIIITGVIVDPAPPVANVDFNGDRKSDWVVTRSVDTGFIRISWHINLNGTNTFTVTPFGLNADVRVPEDFDGDGKTDIAVWRGNGPDPDSAFFYILQSRANTLRAEQFGRTGDDPRVVADYDGDGKADLAVYRTNPNGQNFFFYRSSLTNNNFTSVPFGVGSNVRPNVGDYDGDGKADFCVHVNGQFVILKSGGGAVEYINWGLPTDRLVPGDFDADGKSDFCVVRSEEVANAPEAPYRWYILERDGGGTGASGILWGKAVEGGILTDRLAPGDYDGDGRQDIAVWRPNADSAMNFFYVRRSSDRSLLTHEWGQGLDEPVANWYVH